MNNSGNDKIISVSIHGLDRNLVKRARIAALIGGYRRVGTWINEAIEERLTREERRNGNQ